MLEFGNGTYYARMWFLSLGHVDFLGALFREKDAPAWKFVYRFRYDADDKEPELRNWFECGLPPGETVSESLRKLKHVVNALTSAMQIENPAVQLHELLLETDDWNKVHQALAREDWCHISLRKEARRV